MEEKGRARGPNSAASLLNTGKDFSEFLSHFLLEGFFNFFVLQQFRGILGLAEVC